MEDAITWERTVVKNVLAIKTMQLLEIKWGEVLITVLLHKHDGVGRMIREKNGYM